MNRRVVIVSLGAIAVVGAAGVLLWSAVTTSSARVAATTSGDSFFAAGEVELTQPDSVVELLFDADGLFPGSEVEGCVEVRYDGNVPATIRLHGAQRSGTGLDQYVDLQLAVDPDGDCERGVPGTQARVGYDGRLRTMWGRHGNYDSGVLLTDTARPGDVFAVWATATIADDNRAQGLTTNFSFIIEARP